MFPGDSGCLEADTMKAAGVMSYLVRKKKNGSINQQFSEISSIAVGAFATV
jgi:hypothetical protein